MAQFILFVFGHIFFQLRLVLDFDTEPQEGKNDQESNAEIYCARSRFLEIFAPPSLPDPLKLFIVAISGLVVTFSTT